MTASSSSFFDIEPLECGEETSRYAMDACSLCGKRLAGDSDIFMYRFVRHTCSMLCVDFSNAMLIDLLIPNDRGDTPFCSEECRYSQMVSDDARATRNRLFKTERPAMKEPARVQIAANVPVAI
jgi:hypothetical protein